MTDQTRLFIQSQGEVDDKPAKTIRIPVSGDVFLTELERAIVDTPDFQRLRKYRQLGTSYLVYPGALHTRFDHSLGVLHVAEKMVRCIRDNLHSSEPERLVSVGERRLVRLAALLHDLANVPFGHTLEDETCVVQTYQEDKERFERFIGRDRPIGLKLFQHLGEAEYSRLVRVLSARKDPSPSEPRVFGVEYVSDLREDAFIFDLVKNTVCADLLDYLERDTYFCGLPLQIPDRFLRYLFIHTDAETGVRRLAIRLWKKSDTQPRAALTSELIQLLETRYFLAERVYFHHAKQISSAMIAAAVWHALQAGTLSEEKLIGLGDEELISLLRSSDSPISAKLARGVGDRVLYKRFFPVSRAMLETEKLENRLNDFLVSYHKNAAVRAQRELALAERCGLEAGDVLIYCPHPNMNLKLAEMNVWWRGGLVKLQDIDDELVQEKIRAIQDSHRQLWQLQVFVRPNALKTIEQEDLLREWCRAEFRNPDLYSHAVRMTYEDVLRGTEDEHTVQDVDTMVEETLAVARSESGEEYAFSRKEAASRVSEVRKRRAK